MTELKQKYKITINGHPVVKSDKLDIKLTKEQEEFYEQIAIKNMESSFSFDLRPNWLWQHKQKTGIPKNIEVMPWQ